MEKLVTIFLLCSLGGLSLAIEGPSKADISCTDNQDGTCTVSYLPVLPGDYNILVKYNDKHIPGSPFMAKITGAFSAALIFGSKNCFERKQLFCSKIPLFKVKSSNLCVRRRRLDAHVSSEGGLSG